jgi:hypothetical protein
LLALRANCDGNRPEEFLDILVFLTGRALAETDGRAFHNCGALWRWSRISGAGIGRCDA